MLMSTNMSAYNYTNKNFNEFRVWISAPGNQPEKTRRWADLRKRKSDFLCGVKSEDIILRHHTIGNNVLRKLSSIFEL